MILSNTPAALRLGGLYGGDRRTGLRDFCVCRLFGGQSRPREKTDISTGLRSTVGLVSLAIASYLALSAIGCTPGGVKPVDLYPEDECAHCRMAISDPHFACEVVVSTGEAFKFDDIGCLEAFLNEKLSGLTLAGTFYKDYPSAAWLPSVEATVVETGIMTPMGSGKLAFAGKARAEEFQKQHPPSHRPPQQSSL